MKKYTTSHEWIGVKEEIATIGITHFAQHEIGEIVYIELPQVSQSVQAGDQIAVLESTKAAIDIYTPVSGTILEVNTFLTTRPDLINQDPEGAGWLCKVRLTSSKLEGLLDQTEYERYIHPST